MKDIGKRRVGIFQRDNFRYSPFSRHLTNIASEFQRHNVDVDLLLSHEAGALSAPKGVNVFVFSKWMPQKFNFPRHYVAIFQLIRYMNLRKPDLIIARGVSFAVPALIARVFSNHKPKIFTTIHIATGHEVGNKASRAWRIFRYLVKFTIRKSELTLAVSKGVRSDYARFSDLDLEKLTVLYNPVVTDNILEMAKEDVSDPWISSSDRNHFTILHVGRFSAEKDHRTLLQSLHLVRQELDVRLILLGDGPLRTEIEEWVKFLNLNDHVKILGRKENPFSYMSKCDALVLSSKFEGLPGVLVQAMAVGCPVISTDCQFGAREILEDGKVGRLVPVGDFVQLAGAIKMTLLNPFGSDELKQSASRFSSKEHVKQILKFLQKHNSL